MRLRDQKLYIPNKILEYIFKTLYSKTKDGNKILRVKAYLREKNFYEKLGAQGLLVW